MTSAGFVDLTKPNKLNKPVTMAMIYLHSIDSIRYVHADSKDYLGMSRIVMLPNQFSVVEHELDVSRSEKKEKSAKEKLVKLAKNWIIVGLWENILTFASYILVTKRIKTFWSERFDTFLPGVIVTVWHRNSQPKN